MMECFNEDCVMKVDIHFAIGKMTLNLATLTVLWSQIFMKSDNIV